MYLICRQGSSPSARVEPGARLSIDAGRDLAMLNGTSSRPARSGGPTISVMGDQETVYRSGPTPRGSARTTRGVVAAWNGQGGATRRLSATGHPQGRLWSIDLSRARYPKHGPDQSGDRGRVKASNAATKRAGRCAAPREVVRRPRVSRGRCAHHGNGWTSIQHRDAALLETHKERNRLPVPGRSMQERRRLLPCP